MAKRWQNWSKLKNFFTIVLITYFCIVSIFDLMNIDKVSIFRTFLKNYLWPLPLERNGKNILNILYIISKIVMKDLSSFFKKSEKLSKSGPFLGCCNGITHISDHVILGTNTSRFSWFFYKKNMCLSFV